MTDQPLLIQSPWVAFPELNAEHPRLVYGAYLADFIRQFSQLSRDERIARVLSEHVPADWLGFACDVAMGPAATDHEANCFFDILAKHNGVGDEWFEELARQLGISGPIRDAAGEPDNEPGAA